jgi:hypothetical protein
LKVNAGKKSGKRLPPYLPPLRSYVPEKADISFTSVCPWKRGFVCGGGSGFIGVFAQTFFSQEKAHEDMLLSLLPATRLRLKGTLGHQG